MTVETMWDNQLTISLQAAVPLLVLDLRTMRESARLALIEDWRRPNEAVYAQGDTILYASPRVKPRTVKDNDGNPVRLTGAVGTAGGFAVLARAIAALSHHQGGVRLFGLLWCAEHSASGKAADAQMLCARCIEKYPQAPKGCPCCAGLVAERAIDVDTGGLT